MTESAARGHGQDAALACPACGAGLSAPPRTAGPTSECPACGHRMATVDLREAVSLAEWQLTASRRLDWLSQRLASGETEVAPRQQTARPADRPGVGVGVSLGGGVGAGSGGGGGAVLLAVGALLLVIAGIAFLAFTWSLLGPFGQVAALLVLGAACLFASDRLMGRLPGTATTVGIVGVFLVSIAALGARLLGPDVIGETAALLVTVIVLVVLALAGSHIRPRSAPVGELAGLGGAGIAIAVIATAPGD
ncbi:MAG TPA: hypothetical protein VMT27_05245, partial [Actinomycetes bacterium]|nr:hypothetical protein [Actinomycetes bacterium]